MWHSYLILNRAYHPLHVAKGQQLPAAPPPLSANSGRRLAGTRRSFADRSRPYAVSSDMHAHELTMCSYERCSTHFRCNAQRNGLAQVVDTVIYAVNGRRAFKIDASEVSVDTLEDWQIIILFICQVRPNGGLDLSSPFPPSSLPLRCSNDDTRLFCFKELSESEYWRGPG